MSNIKKLALGVIVVIGLTAIGWLTFDFAGKNPSVEVETDKIESDTEAVIDAGKELIHETSEVLQEVGEDDSERPVE